MAAFDRSGLVKSVESENRGNLARLRRFGPVVSVWHVGRNVGSLTIKNAS